MAFLGNRISRPFTRAKTVVEDDAAGAASKELDTPLMKDAGATKIEPGSSGGPPKWWRANPTFMDDLALAVKAGLVCATAVAPFMPKWFFSGGAVLFFQFATWKTVGETLFLAWCCVMGNLLASLNYLLLCLLPHGSHVHRTVAMANGVLFTWLLCWLNFHTLTRQFALKTWVMYWMLHMTGKKCLWVQKILCPWVQNILWAVTACSLALLITLLPRPRWALWQAEKQARELVTSVGRIWNEVIELYCSMDEDRFRHARLTAKVTKLRVDVGVLNQNLSNAWYECLVLPCWSPKRQRLQDFEVVLFLAGRNLSSSEMLCRDEDYGDCHDELMPPCQELAKKAVAQTIELLELCADAACARGQHPDAATQDKLREGVRLTKEAAGAFSDTFIRKRAELMEQGARDAIYIALLEEHTIGINVCTFGRQACDYAEGLLPKAEEQDQLKHGCLASAKLLLKGGASKVTMVWDFVFKAETLFDREHVLESIRNTVAVIGGFLLGLQGCRGLLNKSNWSIASTIALLVAPGGGYGTVVKKNLDRISGVVLGVVFGQVVFSALGVCEVGTKVMRACVVFVWVTLTLLVSYHSPAYKMIGKLLAAFGAKTMLAQCVPMHDQTNKEFKNNYEAQYEVVISTALSVFVILSAEFAIPERRCALKAHAALKDVWRSLTEDTKKALAGNGAAATKNNAAATGTGQQPPPLASMEDTRRLLAKAGTLGAEAAQEPRLWRTSWREAAFTSIHHCAYDVAALVGMINLAVSEIAGGGRLQSPLQILAGCASFVELRDLLLEMLENQSEVCDVLVYEEPGYWPKLQDGQRLQLIKEKVNQADKARDVVVKWAAAQESLAPSAVGQGGTLLEDGLAQVSLILAFVKMIIGFMRRLDKKLLAEH